MTAAHTNQRSVLGGQFDLLSGVFGDKETDVIFSEEALVGAWLEVEVALAEAQSDLGVIPAEAASAIAAAALSNHIDLQELREATWTVGYPILPLIEQIAADAPKVVGDYLHWGATTQDIMDTALSLQVRRGIARITSLLLALGDRTALLALEHRRTVMAARTHAQQAVPTTFGAKAAVWLDELSRHLERLDAAGRRAIVVQLFGAAGTSASLGSSGAAVRSAVAEKLNIGVADIPWHAARDRLAEVGFVLGALAATCGKIAHEIIDLSRTEIAEVREQATPLSGLSSTMPQKVNPILSETVVAMSVLARERVASLLAAMQAGHERSAGEWQIEWDALPSLFRLAAGSLRNTTLVLDTLHVMPERMRTNLELDGGMVMAEAVMMALAPRVGRLEAHRYVSEACRDARRRDAPLAAMLAETLEPQLLDILPPLDELLAPASYLGDVDDAVETACLRWRATAEARMPQ
jgi:3-carboxy-cis,cis-muconate cycloisomerase